MKKKNLVLLAGILCSFLILSFTVSDINKQIAPPSPTVYPNGNISDKFILGAMNDEEADMHSNYSHALQMGFNISHDYLDVYYDTLKDRHFPKGRVANDGVFNGISEYAQGVRNIIKGIHLSPHGGRKTLLHRPKIEYLCYGQSSVYECEIIDEYNDLWFYSFNNHETGEHYDEPAVKGRYCKAGVDSPGLVVSRLKANTEQTHIDKSGSAWTHDSECRWYVKPKIKIPADFPANNPNTDICKIRVKKYDGVTNRIEVTLKGSDFFDQNGNYNGSYMEEFPRLIGNNVLFFDGDLGNHDPTYYNGENDANYSARGTCVDDEHWQDTILKNRVDIHVEWTGACDMWIDYVKVENDVASELLKGLHDDWLYDEATQIGLYDGGGSEPVGLKFYIELSWFNNLPCMKYVNDKLKQYSNNKVDLMADFTDHNFGHVRWSDLEKITSPEWIYKNYFQKVGFTQFFAESYSMTSLYDHPLGDHYSRIPNTLPYTNGPVNLMLAQAVNPDLYDTWFQDNMYRTPYELENTATTQNTRTDAPVCPYTSNMPQMPGHFQYTMKVGNYISKMSGKPFIFMPPAHYWHRLQETRREVTNEEMEMMANVAIGYGARGLLYFEFLSFTEGVDCPMITYGLQEIHPGHLPGDLIPQNVYKQVKPKWQTIKDIGIRAKKWEQYLLNFKNEDISSYVYTRDCPNGQKRYIKDIKTFKPILPHTGAIESISFETTPEALENRYMQLSFFNADAGAWDESVKYFMITNTRTSPYAPDKNSGGGLRKIKIKLDVSANSGIGMPNYQNFNIVDLGTDIVVGSVYKDMYQPGTTQEVDLGMFNPGEGKLYKIEPMMYSGGTMLGKEYKNSPIDITCRGMLYNNGYDFYLTPGSKINFTSNAGLSFNGGDEAWIAYGVGTDIIELKGINNGTWKGMKFRNMNYVIFERVKIENVEANYFIDAENCGIVALSHCILKGQSNINAGGIQINNLSNLPIQFPDMYIGNTYIDTYSNVYPALKIMAFASQESYATVGNNVITNHLNPGGGIGISLSNINIGAIQSNRIYNYGQGISASSSSLDLFGNTITTSINYNGVGEPPSSLFGASSTVLNLAPSGGTYTGGENNFSVKQGNCISLNSSYFNMAKGVNFLNIVQSDWRHLYGYFPSTGYGIEDASQNCFRINGRDPSNDNDVKRYVIDAYTNPINFDFLSFNCMPMNHDGYFVVEGDIINDTLWTDGSGNGGGQSSVSNNEDFSFKAIYDSMNINLRKKQYELVQNKCKILLDQYPDSVQTIDAVGKLYSATLAKDSAGNKIQPLKSYFESFIQNHSTNTKLVQRIFYFLQKCKVRLNQYASAMQGFQTIMTQFPTTYEGLVAKWDYTATHLLDSMSGSSGGEQSTFDFEQLSIEEQHNKLTNLVDDPNDKYDKKKFTKEDRKVIVQNIVTSFEIEKAMEVQKVKTLEQKVINNEASKMEKSDYNSKKLLKTVVKTEVARTIDEHIDIVQKDLEKVFSLKEGHGGVTDEILTVVNDYKLHQNYPNPFNPSTKINYELKNPGFVSLKIYDLLGREVAELVNETKDAGRYTIDFNASKYMMASGIYFYRIKAGEFVDTKRMVLVK